MENTIRETLKGLELALGARNDKIAEINGKDDTALIEDKKAELQKEFDEKLKAFVDGINEEKEKALAKLNRDVETINELIGEYNDKLVEIEAHKEEVVETTETDGGEEVELKQDEIAVDETEKVEENVVFGQVVNPFRP